jgi:hypothetical protein
MPSISRECDDRRHAHRLRVRAAVDHVVADLQRDAPGHIVLGALIRAARRVNHLEIELAEPGGRPSRTGRARS